MSETGEKPRTWTPDQAASEGRKRHAPAAKRNRDALLDVLGRLLPRGEILEIACGSGEHAVHLGPRLPGRRWLATDASPAAVDSARAWIEELPPADARALAPPALLDATDPDSWPVVRTDAVVCVNMLHISPWTACQGLMAGCGRILPPGGVLVLYGPFLRHGIPTAPSNQAFDDSLRSQDPAWGLRALEAVTAEAEANGLILEEVVEMPANNLTVLFRRR
jgi:SAM-dependent methyltransferase